VTTGESLTAMKEVPDLYELADEIEANGMVEAASKVRAAADYVDTVEKQLDMVLAEVTKQSGEH